jgi:hypothetical protein
VLLAVVFGTGLFAGWVYGTRNAGSLPSTPLTATAAPMTIAGNSLDAMREAGVEKVRPVVVQINIVTSSGEGLGSGVIMIPAAHMTSFQSGPRQLEGYLARPGYHRQL